MQQLDAHCLTRGYFSQTDWSIRDKIITVTRDNGANIVAAIKLMDIDAVPCSTLQYPAWLTHYKE